MRIRTIVIVAAAVLGFRTIAGPASRRDDLPIYKDPSRPVAQRVEDLLNRMTVEEKIAQLRSEWADYHLYVKQGGKAEMSEALKKVLTGVAIGKLAGLLRADPFSGVTAEAALTPAQGAELVNQIQRHIREQTRLGIPILIGNDGNHCHLGLRGTIFPSNFSVGPTWNRQLEERIGRAIAAESRSRGETVVYAPDLDVLRDPRYGRSEQNYGEDPYLVGQMGAAMVRGLQGKTLNSDRSVIALLRAYPGCGDDDGGHDFGETSRGTIEMQEFVLRPWRDAVRAGAEGIMVERAIYDSVPAPASKYLMTNLLRNEWGFKGFTMGDASNVLYLLRCRVARNNKEGAALALKAGMDVNLNDAVIEGNVYGKTQSVAYGKLGEALEEGLVSMEDIDRAVRRVLRVKFLLGLFENPYSDPAKAEALAGCAEHRQLALEAAREGIVLLENRNSILPLRKDIKSVAVIGPNADDEWAQLGDYAPAHPREQVTTILDGIRKKVSGNTMVRYARGCGIRDCSRSGFLEALEAVRQSDAVVAVVGGSSKAEYVKEGGQIIGRRSAESDSGEGTDRATLDLLGVQEDLLKAVKESGKSLIVVLIHGRAMTINWVAKNADAIIDAGFPGEAGGAAIADVLFGDYNPGGRLTVSFPKHVGQLPAYYYSRFNSRSHYVEMDAEPLYSFGFGLSYTTFEYKNLKVTPAVMKPDQTARVSVEVANTGTRAGDEVVQLYIRDEECSVVRPWKQLKGFERVHLQPGETKTVSLPVGREELCFYGLDGKWTVEPGRFTIMVSKNVRKDLLAATLTVRGVVN